MQKLLLRPLLDEDIVLLEKWLYKPHIYEWYHDPSEWIDEVKKRNDEFSFLHHFIVEINDKAVGFCQYYEYCRGGEDWHGSTDINGSYSIDYLIGDIEYLNKGFGKETIRLLIEKIKLQSNAKSIIVQPEQGNKASRNTLLSCGFFFDENNGIFIMKL